MEQNDRKYHRTKVIEINGELITIGYYWEVDDHPFEGGHLIEKEEVIRRHPALRVVEESA